MKFEGINDDDIVISGVGLSLPDVNNLEDLNKLLFDGANPIKHDDTVVPVGYYGKYPEYQGHINDPWKFDCTFFGVSKVVARSMDPMVRKILERTFEAILDAGMNPADLKGTNSAFFSGTTFSDYDLEWDTHFRGGYGIMGRNRCMNANRVSYWLDTHGTSVATDCNWADGIVNLELAWNAIKNGHCDTAVVNGASITIHNELMLQIRDMGVLCYDGKTKSFDDSADGYVRSDGVCVLVLQRASIAKRCYAAIQHVFSQTCGSPRSIYTMSSEHQWEDFLRRFYENSKINPLDVCYYEANGTGIKDEDAKELNAATTIFCKNRTNPLYIGSIKSNIGHTEAASALTSVIKAIVCLENQKVPGNLHFSSPNSKVPGLVTGKLQVVNEHLELPKGGLVAVSSYGYGGVYAHVVLKPNQVTRAREPDSVPRLVFMADRMADTIETLLDKIEEMPYNEEYYGLLHSIHSKKVGKYLGRGYTILPKKEGAVLRETEAYNEEKRPVWFIFSGMGSQWNGMGKALLALPLFRESIERSAKVLAPKNIDLIQIITSEDPAVFDNILHAFVGIAAIQVALVDILNALEIVPDGIIGHSVGELGCSYADGGLTAEQMVLCAYYRGLASIETQLMKGFMAAIGKGYNDIKDLVPPEVDVACHNSSDSCTLSGPADIVREYVEKLKEEKVFAKTVNVADIAYHSRYIEPVAPKLLKYLKEVIKEPKLRSSKWICTSTLEEEWETDVAKFCSAEYHTKNLLNSVLFEEGSKHIPNNAICIEIAPHGLLQAILKRSLDTNCVHIPLTRRTAEDPLLFLLQAFGKMYLAGMHPQISKLYPQIEYPVSRGTPSLTQLVHWNFEHEFTPNFRVNKKVVHSIRDILLKTSPDSTGCVIDGRSVYPASIYLRLIWDISAMYVNKTPNDFSAVVRNFRLDKPFHFLTADNSDVTIMVNTGTRYLEMSTEENEIIGHGFIYHDLESSSLSDTASEDAAIAAEPVDHSLNKEDIYSEFRHRGYDYCAPFQPLDKIDIRKSAWVGSIPSNLDWTQKLEALIQLVLLQKGERDHSLLYPVSIGRVTIAPQEHLKALEGNQNIEVTYSLPHDTVRCAGIELYGIRVRQLEQPKSTLSFEVNHIVPYAVTPKKSASEFVEECIRIVSSNMSIRRKFENQGVNVLRIIGLESSQLGAQLPERVHDVQVNLKTEKASQSVAVFVDDSVDLVIADFASLKHVATLTGRHSLVLVRGVRDTTIPAGFQNVSSIQLANGEHLFLLNKASDIDNQDEFLTIADNELVLINILNNRDVRDKTFYLVGYEEPAGGAESYIRHVDEATSVPIRWLFILDKKAPPFSPEAEEYKKQLRKGLSNNVYYNGAWGYFEKKHFTEQVVEKDLDFIANSIKNGEITYDYVGINLESNKNITDILTDFSGRLRTNTRVMGVLSVNKNSMVHDPDLIWQVPPTWSQEEAATVPLPYLFAYYTIGFLGNLLPYENVLVTDACSYNSQAAITLALKYANNVYVTVANEDEKLVVKKLFPQIKPNHIFLHARNDFNLAMGLEVGAKAMPQVIFNTLEGEKFVGALRCLSSFGRFFNFGREDIENNRQIGSSTFLKYNTLYQITAKKLINLDLEDRERIHGMFFKGLKEGVVKPFAHVKFTQDNLSIINSFDDLQKKSHRILFNANMIRKETNSLDINSEGSYVIIGDATEVWLDLAEGLLQRGATKLVIVRSDEHTSERAGRRIGFLTSQPNTQISILEEKNTHPKIVLNDVQKLGPLAAVFLISLANQDNGFYSKVDEIDRLWKDKNGHLVVISSGQYELSKLCETRLAAGLPTINLLWEADQKLISSHLEAITQLSGKEAVISVTNSIRNQNISHNAGRVFLENLPKSLDDFAHLGYSLGPQVDLIELPTLGVRMTEAKNLSPFIFITSLHTDPVRLIAPIARRLRYPALVAKLPHFGKQTVPAIASCLHEKIRGFKRQYKTFNIVGLASGCAVALELTHQLELNGGKVSLILLDNPIVPMQQGKLNEKTVDSVLLSLLASKSKKLKELPPQSWREGLNLTMSLLDLEPHDEGAVASAAEFVNHQLCALLNYNIDPLRLKGPLAVLHTQQHSEDFCYTKMCHNVVVREYPMDYQNLLDSETFTDLLHQASLCDDMGHVTINECSWTELESFIIQDREASFQAPLEATFAYMRPVAISQDEANIITL